MLGVSSRLVPGQRQKSLPSHVIFGHKSIIFILLRSRH